MLDSNWDLINGDAAHEIEVLNYANQVNVIAAMLRLVIHKDGVGPDGCPNALNANALRELHRTGTLFLLEKPGFYRETEVVVYWNGQVSHTPPPAVDVPLLMEAFDLDIAARWGASSPVQTAAYTLWRLNWIHPFKNGNGRTARAFAYACLSMKYGFELPGAPTVIDMIMANRDEYTKALQHADETLHSTGTPDLALMEAFIERLLVTQLASLGAANS